MNGAQLRTIMWMTSPHVPVLRMAVLGDASMILGTHDFSFASAAAWMASAMTGTLATIVATLAIAGLGAAMLQGRLSVQRGARVVLGCFILFAAPYMAKQLVPTASRTSYANSFLPAEPLQVLNVPAQPQPNSDPYAGASVPMQ